MCAYLFAYVPGGDGEGLGTIPESPSGKQRQQQRGTSAGNPRLVVAFRGAASLEDALCGGTGAPQAPLRTGNLTKGGAFPAPKCAGTVPPQRRPAALSFPPQQRTATHNHPRPPLLRNRGPCSNKLLPFLALSLPPTVPAGTPRSTRAS